MINSQITLSFALRILIYFSAFFLLLISILNLDFDIILLTILYIITSLFLLEKFLSFVYLSHTSLLFILLFCIGFYLQLGLIIYDPYIFGFSGFTSLGNFNFEFNQFLEIYLVTVVSTSGILVGIYLATRTNINKLYLALSNYSLKKKVKKKYITTLIMIWIIALIILNYYINYLGIGRHGLANETVLPNFVAGFLSFMRGFFLSGLSYCIYDLLVKNSNNYHKILFFFIFIFSTIYIALMYSLSKSALIYQNFPFFILMIFNSNQSLIKKYKTTINLKFLIYLTLFIILFLFVTSYMEQKRAYLYSNIIEEFNFINLFEILKAIIVRVEGARDLFLVTDYQNKGLEAYLSANLGTFSPPDELYGFSLKGTAFGLTIGFQGLAFLSGSYIITFLHSLVFFFILSRVEIFFKIRGLFVFSIYITTIMTLLVWMNIDMYTIFRYAVITILIVLTCSIIKNLFFIKSLKKIN